MPARQRLNSLYAFGICCLAAWLGWSCQSWSVFTVALAVGLALALHSGGIRVQPAADPSHRSRRSSRRRRRR